MLQPFLMGRFVSVHPLGVIVAIGCGVLLAGIAGALVAVPFASAVNAVGQHLARHRPGDEAEELARIRGTADATLERGRPERPTTPDHEDGATSVTDPPTLDDIEAAREVLDGVAVATPMEESRWLSALAGGPVLLKCENLQRTGSFKIRGAYVRIPRLSDGGARPRRGRGQRRQPRAGRRARRPDARHQGHGLHARGRADPQGEGHPRLRRRGGLPRPSLDDALVAARQFADETGRC